MSAVLDEALLDDTGRLLDADRAGVLRAAATAGAQVRATWAAARDAGIGVLGGLRPRALVLIARPGAERAVAGITAALLEPTCPCPVVVTGSAPPWLGPLDVVVVSHRGSERDPADAAIAEAVDRAVRRNAHVVLTGPPDGPAAAAAAGRAIQVAPRVPVLDGLGGPTDLAAAYVTARELGLLDVDGEALADRLDDEAERSGPRPEAFVAPAKALALRVADHTPLLWGTDRTATAVAGYGATALAAHAGVVAHADGLDAAVGVPALAARLDGGTGADSIFADPFDDPAPDGPPPRLVVVTVAEDVPTRRLAQDAQRRWPAADTLELDDLELAGPGPGRDALRAGVLALRLDLAALYLGLATGAVGVDPDTDRGTLPPIGA
ncbi:hypothetical protein WCD74_25725 [Actinomycetospora sp. OC33-EN08]|uniref:Bifunctional glucose-6-phosphate/mannose-6-phosphate isomerase C-terminal domain-containing protein n=1 Tax=Actinomycetospora aurantiaca TaxID=3129233 RepID=A0ABU8MV49_9PSEU